MPTTITGTDGVSQVQTGAVESGDLAAGAIGSGDLPAGSVIQVVSNVVTTIVSSNSTSYIDTGVSETITPKFSSSKILILINQSWEVRENSGPDAVGQCRILRDGSEIIGGFLNYSYDFGNNGTIQQTHHFFQYLDSPNTTSSIEYKVQGRRLSGANFDFQKNNSPSVITLMEIAG